MAIQNSDETTNLRKIVNHGFVNYEDYELAILEFLTDERSVRLLLSQLMQRCEMYRRVHNKMAIMPHEKKLVFAVDFDMIVTYITPETCNRDYQLEVRKFFDCTDGPNFYLPLGAASELIGFLHTFQEFSTLRQIENDLSGFMNDIKRIVAELDVEGYISTDRSDFEDQMLRVSKLQAIAENPRFVGVIDEYDENVFEDAYQLLLQASKPKEDISQKQYRRQVFNRKRDAINLACVVSFNHRNDDLYAVVYSKTRAVHKAAAKYERLPGACDATPLSMTPLEVLMFDLCEFSAHPRFARDSLGNHIRALNGLCSALTSRLDSIKRKKLTNELRKRLKKSFQNLYESHQSLPSLESDYSAFNATQSFKITSPNSKAASDSDYLSFLRSLSVLRTAVEGGIKRKYEVAHGLFSATSSKQYLIVEIQNHLELPVCDVRLYNDSDAWSLYFRQEGSFAAFLTILARSGVMTYWKHDPYKSLPRYETELQGFRHGFCIKFSTGSVGVRPDIEPEGGINLEKLSILSLTKMGINTLKSNGPFRSSGKVFPQVQAISLRGKVVDCYFEMMPAEGSYHRTVAIDGRGLLPPLVLELIRGLGTSMVDTKSLAEAIEKINSIQTHKMSDGHVATSNP